MNIRVNIKEFDPKFDTFMKMVIPSYLRSRFLKQVDLRRLKYIDKEFDIDSKKIILYALNNLSVDQTTDNVYNIHVNKNLKIDNVSIMSYINEITYGNRTTKGYPILIDIFKYTTDHIYYLFGRWKDGYKIL